jgi:ATP-dependent helicase/nuclease subunit B
VALFGPHSVYSIDAASRFADSLALGLLAAFPEPEALAAVQIYLPNRRAMRALDDALLKRAQGKALLMPRLMALGDIGDDDSDDFQQDAALDMPLPLDQTQRVLAVLPLVSKGLEKIYNRTSGFGDVLRYTRALLRIFDQLQYGSISKPDIVALSASGAFADHWQRILNFLDIALSFWPATLRAINASDPIDYRIAHINALTQRWAQHPPITPIIAAGTTGTIPAVRQLLKRIATLPHGCVVLPPAAIADATDADLWQALGPTHPAFALKQLLDTLDRTPDSIAPWPYPSTADCSSARTAWTAQAFLPASLSHHWRSDPAVRATTAHIQVVEAAHPAEEAQVIALAMRQALDVPGRTAALVTPDRPLARRVAQQLQRFDIDIDDSAGTPLAASRVGIFLALLSEVGLQACAPVPLLALLKHPLCHGAENRVSWLDMVRHLDADCLRGPRPAAGWHGLRSAGSAAKTDITLLLNMLEPALAPWLAAHDGRTKPLSTWVHLHLSAAEALAGADALWAGDAGRAAHTLMQALMLGTQPLTAADYATLIQDFLKSASLRPAFGKHPRLAIWGPLEARLQRADLMILGGLNEGVWPEPATVDPVLNEAMRETLHLPTSEFRIGQSAMDFISACHAPEVLITRALKSAEGPTITSRFLQRLDASTPQPLARGAPLLLAARGIDQPAQFLSTEEPLPRPALHLRPRLLHVTDVERLRRNPYAFYARSILKLKQRDALDADPGAADRGSRIHDALDTFFSAESSDLLHHLKIAFADLWDRPQVQALWVPRFKHMAAWISEQHDPAWQPWRSEHAGVWVPQAITPHFELRGRADRVDMAADKSSLRIIDYKTGSAPTSKQLLAGFSLQLPLLAHIAEHGGFEDIEAMPVTALEAWVLKGRAEEAGKIEPLFKKDNREAIMDRAVATLYQLIHLFDREASAYRFKAGPARGGGQEYHHLARVDAWQGRQP